MLFFTFSHLALMTHIIPYDVRFFNMIIILFIPTIHEMLSLTQGILHMSRGNKTLCNKSFLPCIIYIIFPN
jgi:hypothetical protein